MKAKSTFLASIVLAGAFLAGCGGGNTPPNGGGNNPVPMISSISPTSVTGGSGDITVTVTGSGFVSASVVQWNGSTRASTFDNSKQLRASIPASDLASTGIAQIAVVSPSPGGGTSAPALIAVNPEAGGTLLLGTPNSPAVGATFDIPGVGVDSSLIVDGVILNQLEVFFSSSATVGQVNDALGVVQGGILSMAKGFTFVTVVVPTPATVDELEQVAEVIGAAPAVVAAFPAQVPVSQVLPTDPAAFSDLHLLAPRFPAAWNAQELATKGCETHKVPVLVPDDFVRPAPVSHNGFSIEIPNFTLLSAGEQGEDAHGYDVTTTLAAMFNGASPTGANPFPQCLDITGVQISGLGWRATMDRAILNFPTSVPFIMNISQGFNDECEVEIGPDGEQRCTAQSVRNNISKAYRRAVLAKYWKQRTHDQWSEFLLATSAGNALDEMVAKIYTGPGAARFESPMNVATDPDPFFTSIGDSSLWSPISEPDLPNLTATSAQQAALRAEIIAEGLDRVPGEDNVLMTGSTTMGATFDDLRQSAFSNFDPDLRAVGEDVNTFSGLIDGTSFTAPQVAGLASYLWLLSNDLRAEPSQTTRQAIVDNARSGPGGKVIDAYATVLSLDGESLPTPTNAPVRFAILNVNNDSKFDEDDLRVFLGKYLDGSGNPIEPSAPDYSRFDLNGDGLTGGSKTERFDLDRAASAQCGASTQFGTTSYCADIVQQVEGRPIDFNENAVTDMQILCYYAYSDMYTGDAATRSQLIGSCAGVTVLVDPQNVRLSPGATQQFSATVRGSNDPRVTWSVTGSGNSIDSSGLLTAGSASGTFTVRATSVANRNAFGEATVTVTGCSTGNRKFLKYFLADTETLIQPDPDTTASQLSDSLSDSDSSASVTVRYGSIQTAAHADALHAVNSNGNGTHDGGAQSLGQFEDAFTIVPDDPSLQGSTANGTISFRVTASPHVSGDRAASRWFVNSTSPFTFFASGTLSTVEGKSSGDVTGGTYSVSGPVFLGFDTGIDLMLGAAMFYECGDQPCDKQQGLTGAGDTTAKIQWLGMTVKDQSGNPVAFTVCSNSGTNWAAPQ